MRHSARHVSVTELGIPRTGGGSIRSPRTLSAGKNTQLPEIVVWSFLLFIFTFPFEATPVGAHSIAKLVGLGSVALYFAYFNPLNRGLPPVPRALWWLAAYLAIYIVSVVRVPSELLGQFVMRVLTLVQLLVFFWVASDMMKRERMAKIVLLAYCAAASLFAVGILLQVPGFSQEIVPGRVTGAGENLNLVATHMGIAVLAAVGLLVGRMQLGAKLTLLLGFAIVPMLLALISTGSRGGIAAFLAGIFVYLLPYWKKKHTILTIAACVLATVGVVYLVKSTPHFLARWEQSFYEGKFSDRENIFLDALAMISDKPILGWGPVEYAYELGFRGGSAEPNDTHNLLFHLFAEVGVIGTIPFVVGIGIILRNAWIARSGVLGLLPLALMAALLTANLSANNLVWKPQWLVLALATAAVSSANRQWGFRSVRRYVATGPDPVYGIANSGRRPPARPAT
jgi:O-antigen ligase